MKKPLDVLFWFATGVVWTVMLISMATTIILLLDLA